MGNICSCAKQVVQNIGHSLLSKLNIDFTDQEWEQAHNSGTLSENSSQLNSLGINLESSSSLPTNLKKAVFICCNTYERPDYSLGVGPMNDAITVSTFMKEHGFTVYYAHNPKSSEFTKYFSHFLKNTTQYLLVYYTGHGASVEDDDGDEQDNLDEALVFDDNFIRDDELARLISSSGKPSGCKVLLLNDCCHSGSIYDLQSGKYQGYEMPQNIMSLSAARDSQTAKQTSVGGKDQGIFTFYFFKLLESNPKLTPAEMESKINSYIAKYEQQFTKFATTDSLLTSPILP